MKLGRALLAAGLSACCACNGVGRALVDYEPPSAGEEQQCSAMRCQGVLPTLIVPDTPREYGDMSSCGEPSEASEASLPLGNCRCQSLELDLPAASALSVLLLGPASFENCRVHLRSDRPFEVHWTASRLQNVHIFLDGPISLSMRDSTLTRVSLATSSQQALLSFDECDVALFSLYGPTLRMPTLNASGTTFGNALLETDEASFVSVGLHASALTARSFNTADLTATHARLKIDQGLISASRLNEVEVSACTELRVLGTRLTTVEVSCRDRIDLFSSRAQQSVLDGPIEFDDAETVGTTFGLRQATSLVSFVSSFINTNLCQHVLDARFQGGFGSCIDCQGPLVSGEAFLCGESSFDLAGSANPCAAVAALRSCASFPARTRPQ